MKRLRLEDLLKNTGDMALKRRALNIVKGLNPQFGENILDVGCGDGYYLYLLSNLDVDIKLFGVDCDREALRKAKNNLPRKIILKYGDLMTKLPFKSSTFDKVVISEVLEHLPDENRGLKEVRRVLKKRGVLCVSVPNANYPFFWDPVNWTLERFFNIHIQSGFFSGIWNQHERLYTPDHIKKTVKRAGFKVKQVRPLTWWCLPFNHYIVNIVARGLAHGSFSVETKKALSKYTKNPKRNFILNLAFKIVNVLDKLNDFYSPNNRGVSVFVLACKK